MHVNVRCWLAIALMAVLLAGASACGGGSSEPTATPTQSSLPAAAQRPDWFPATFPLPAATTVTTQQQEAEAGGGSVTFDAPVPFEQAVKVFDLNLESHGYQISDRSVTDTTATYKIDSSQFSGSVNATDASGHTTIQVTLTPK